MFSSKLINAEKHYFHRSLSENPETQLVPAVTNAKIDPAIDATLIRLKYDTVDDLGSRRELEAVEVSSKPRSEGAVARSLVSETARLATMGTSWTIKGGEHLVTQKGGRENACSDMSERIREGNSHGGGGRVNERERERERGGGNVFN